jgi:hypothetical protein
MRRKLLNICPTRKAIFMDDDAVLSHDALDKLVEPPDTQSTLFVEGIRIEVGGRERDNSGPELKAGIVGVNGINEINHGDTFLLFFDVGCLRRVSSHESLDFYDKVSVPGEDFALTMLAKATYPEHRAYCQPEAIAYHLASPHKGYWSNFAAIDAYTREKFADAVGGERGEKIRGFVEAVYKK